MDHVKTNVMIENGDRLGIRTAVCAKVGAVEFNAKLKPSEERPNAAVVVML